MFLYPTDRRLLSSSKLIGWQFDDLAAPPSGAATATPPTPYHGLDYVGITYVSESDAVNGVLPHSPRNEALILQLGGTGVGALTTVYANSKISTFDLTGFWFGCTTTGGTQGNAVPAEQCTITVTGYKQSPTNPAVCDIAGVG